MSKKTDRFIKQASATVAARHARAEPTADRRPTADRSTTPTIVVDSPAPTVVDSLSTDKPVFGEKKMLTRINADRKGSSIIYSLGEGVRGTVKFARSVFGVVVPDTLPDSVSEWPVTSGSKAKAKMTKEERAALRAAETPADRLQKAKDIAARAAAKAAKLEAALNG